MIFAVAFPVFLLFLTMSRCEENFQTSGIQVEKKNGEMIEALMHPEENRCYGNKCSGNEDCCVGAVCVEIEGGTCLPMYGRKFVTSCEQDKDCASGFLCLESGDYGSGKTCQIEGRIMKKKAYNDPCMTSADCDVTRGLCCQVLRRHRQAPKRVCHYFLDPMSCLGQVETDLKPIHFIPNPFFKARLG